MDKDRNIESAKMEDVDVQNIDANEEEQHRYPWYAIKLYGLSQKNVEKYLQDKGLETFIPQEYVDVEDSEHKVKHVLRPVVKNLIFLKKTMEEGDIKKVISSSELKMSVITVSKIDKRYCEIPARQMDEFMLMCNPDILLKKFISEDQAHLKKGALVRVKRGPLQGFTGRLVRANKNYYLLKDVPGMAVLLKVTKWCCVALE
ncbi:MAG: UpxY family transcription antiterminator [Prevotella sp.]|jgi:transcription antitermination factor NusG|nr:UpxY family transcription antiterminator [Prevotella sp.]MBP8757711.1 UpxY family transcription antiterminator [Prevotella sp.]MBP9985234.1 UpxY family transcription antiterminator [Prevotella sp.]MDY0153270.1 UpxY family transcription antiterminator [Prevotella sp.]